MSEQRREYVSNCARSYIAFVCISCIIEVYNTGVYPEIQDSQHKLLFRHRQDKLHQRPGSGHTDKGERDAEYGEKHHGGGYSFQQILLHVRTVVLRNDNAAACAESQRQTDQKKCDRSTGTDGGQRGLADKLPDHNAVDRMVELLQEIACHDGNCEKKDLFGNVTGGHTGLIRMRHRMIPPISARMLRDLRKPNPAPFSVRKKKRSETGIVSGLFLAGINAP